MTRYESITIVISTISFISSTISLAFTSFNARHIEKIYQGQTELSIRESINFSKNRITDLLANTQSTSNLYLDQCIKVAIEQLLNSYEEACSKYLDSKIDKKRFKKLYFDEIKNIIESQNFESYFKFGSKYDAIKQVYSEWFNLEK